MDNNENLKKLLEVYNEIVLPTVYDDTESYYETLGRIRYVLNELAKQGAKDYTADFQKILEDVKAQEPVLEGKISTETSEEGEAIQKTTTALNNEIQARKDADTALESEVESTVNNLSNIGINRGLIYIYNDDSAQLTADDLKRFKYFYSVKSELADATTALQNANFEIEDPRIITDIVFAGMAEASTASSSVEKLVSYKKMAYPNSIVYIMPYSNNPLATDNLAKREAMITACQEGAFYLGCTYMSYTRFKESAAQEITMGQSDYEITGYYRSELKGSAETNPNAHLTIKITAKPYGLHLKTIAEDENNNETDASFYPSNASYTYTKSFDFGITDDVLFINIIENHESLTLKTDSIAIGYTGKNYYTDSENYIIV